MEKIVEVAAAIVLREAAGGTEYLLAQRPEGKVYAGYWEFPGGKREAGETLDEALRRELHEELGIAVERAHPWLSREFSYPHALVRLKFFRVRAWRGEVSALEHSALCWTRLGDTPSVSPVLPANGPILRALALPARYAITNAAGQGAAAELARLERALAGGLRLIQVRDKSLPAAERRRFAEGVVQRAARYSEARVLINDDEALAREVNAHGVHLSSSRLRTLTRPPAFAWLAASCHGARDLAQAVALGADFAVLGPVLPTPTHPESMGIGWAEFARLIERTPIPVHALGGMRPGMLEAAQMHGAHGIALLRAW